jgi:hypothetical protein
MLWDFLESLHMPSRDSDTLYTAIRILNPSTRGHLAVSCRLHGSWEASYRQVHFSSAGLPSSGTPSELHTRRHEVLHLATTVCATWDRALHTVIGEAISLGVKYSAAEASNKCPPYTCKGFFKKNVGSSTSSAFATRCWYSQACQRIYPKLPICHSIYETLCV